MPDLKKYLAENGFWDFIDVSSKGVFPILRKESKRMRLKYTCPGWGTPLCYDGLCWKCKSGQD